MSGWAYAFCGLLALHLVAEFVSARLIYWQRRHIAALKEARSLDAAMPDRSRCPKCGAVCDEIECFCNAPCFAIREDHR